MKPQSISEQLMYNTIRIESRNGIGTGSFFEFKIGNWNIPVIITNKHVVNDNPNETVSFYVHVKNKDGEANGNIAVKWRTNWIFHSVYDLCFCYAEPIFKAIQEDLKLEPFYVASNISLISSQPQLEELSLVEELTMIGYPIGLYDEINNLPIFRRGYPACHPSIDFNRKGIGLIDMACFPGSSGSPIYILNESSYPTKNGELILGNRIILLGYLFAVPVYSANGQIIVKEIPTNTEVNVNTNIMTNLGYYIKASALEEFKKEVERQCNEQKE